MEVYSSIYVIKYIHKCVNKSSDRTTVALDISQDGVSQYLQS